MVFKTKVNSAILFALFLTLAIGLGHNEPNRLLQYNTNPTRTQTVLDLCSQFPNRTKLVDQQAEAENQVYSEYMYAHFAVTGTQIVQQSIADPSNAVTVLTALISPFVTFLGAFLVGFVVIIIIWMPLCCCCCCPHGCPSKCCRKDENEQYSKCELYWPTIVLIVAILLTLVAGVIGLTKAGDLQNSINAVTCSFAITFDDLINGNITSAGTFFIGIRTLYFELDTMSADLGDIDTQISAVGTGGADTSDAITKADTAMDDIDFIPTGTSGDSVPAFTYETPFDSSSTSALSSTFPDELGDINSPGTKIFNAYTEVSETKIKINSIAESADTFSGSISTFQSAVGGVRDTINTFADLLQGIDLTFYGIINDFGQYLTIVTTVITAFFGVIVGFSVLVILGALLMTFCEKYKCRYLIYFACVFLFIIGIVGFLLSTLLSAIVPAVYFTCEFLEFSVESKANFDASFGALLGTQTTSYFTVCLASESGDIIGVIGGDTTETIDSLSEVIAEMSAFNSTEEISGVSSQWNSLNSLVTQTYAGDVLDFSSSSDVTILNTLAEPSNYGGCTANNFQSDSWIPSINVGTIACTSSAGNDATSTQCPNQAAIQSGASPCLGCLDSQSILPISDGGSGVAVDLKARYPGGGACDTWADQMQNVYTNFYGVKETQFVTNSINSRTSTADSSVSSFTAAVTTVGNTFDTTLTNLDSVSSSITDPKYGLVAGLNCRIFGEDMQLILNTFCATFFNVFYFLRLALGIGSFGILFSMCCAVCSGVRHFKHGQRKDKLMPTDTTGTMGNLNSKM